MIIPLNTAINASKLDSDALLYIKEIGLTDPTSIRAINELCKDLKYYDIWDSLYVIFPMVYTGDNSGILVDLKNRFNLTESVPTSGSTASPTYSSNGIKYNGGIYHTSVDLTPSLNSNTPPSHISIYNRTGLTSSSKHGYYESFGGNQYSIGFGVNGVSASLWNDSYYEMGFSTSSQGFFIFSNVDDNNGLTASNQNPYTFYLSRNGVVVGTESSVLNKQGLGSKVTIGALLEFTTSTNNSFDEICWYSFGSGFDGSVLGENIDLDKQNIFYQIVQKFQTKLGRSV